MVASQSVKGGGKLYIRIFPQKSITSIPAETRMGKGKGEVEYWAAIVKPGTILYELAGVSEEQARASLARVAHKLPVRCRFVDPPAHSVTPFAGPNRPGESQPGLVLRRRQEP